MKNLLKKTYKKLVASLMMAAMSIVFMTAYGQNTGNSRIDALDDLSFLEILNSPEVGDCSEIISKFQMKEGQNNLLRGRYKDKNIKVEMIRNKEVLLITIPASELFDPNEIVLNDKAAAYLDPIKRYLKNPDMYRVLLAMHTDNTGSQQYRDVLTEERVDAVFDYFEEGNVDTRYLFSYALSDDLPIVENNSVLNREKNRRLEIYLVPGEKMIEQAKRKRIAF